MIEKSRLTRPKLLRLMKFMVFDILVIVASNVFAVMYYTSSVEAANVLLYLQYLPILIVAQLIVFYVLRFYHFVMEYVGLEDIFKIGITVIVSNFIIFLIALAIQMQIIPWPLYLMTTFIEAMAICGVRLSKRFVNYVRRHSQNGEQGKKRVLIVGSGSGGVLVLKELRNNPDLNSIPVVFVDDDQKKIGEYIKGIEITGPIAYINQIIERHNVDEVIIGIANLSNQRLKEIIELASKSKVTIKRLPLMKEMKQGDSGSRIMDVKIEDLLNRDEIQLDNEGIHDFIKENVVMVTGAGGSIGSELCRQIIQHQPTKLIMLDIYENGIYDIQMELERHFYKNQIPSNLEVLIGSVYNIERMEGIFKRFHPDIVFHAAAYKHVPLMEHSPVEAIRTNVIGTYNIATLCAKYHVSNFVLVSSDKAVRPTNAMGATKRFAEMIAQWFAKENNGTRYSMVRFGNVLGSNGSVVPLFKKQILDGGPVTVTHPEITRFFMTIPEAVSLILQSAVYSQGGEIFILDMGEPVKIKDLAEKMIRLSGYTPYADIDIQFVGLRPGEKLYEELLVDHNSGNIKTSHERIFIERRDETRFIEDDITFIRSALDHNLDDEEVKKLLSQIVKTYTYQK